MNHRSKTPSVFFLLITVLTAGLLTPALADLSHADREYLSHLALAIEEMDHCNWTGANQHINAALEFRRNEPLAYLIRGILFIQIGAFIEAQKSFDEADLLGGEKSLSAYGKALTKLGLRDFSGAESILPTPDSRISVDELRIIRSYISLLSSGRAQFDTLPETDPRVLQMKAFTQLRSGSRDDLTSLLLAMPADNPDESNLDRGVVMGFDSTTPLNTLVSSSVRTSITHPGGPVTGYSGTVRLRADRHYTPDAEYFLFYVGSRLIGIVNSQPYELSWDTTRFANGIHTVTIRGQAANGMIVGETSQNVLVANPVPQEGEPIRDPIIARILDAAWESIKIRGSHTWGQYHTGRYNEANNRTSDALLNYARILAAQPSYRDTKDRWISLTNYRASAPLWKGSNSGRSLALTFDDGPNEGTPGLLQTLDNLKLTGTFFLVGSQVRRHPDLVRQIAAAGHELAGHSETHRSLKEMSEEEIIRELFGPIAAIQEVTGQIPRYFRPPGGHFNTQARQIAESFGLTAVMWSANCGPYEGGPVKAMEEYVASAATPGGIVLMHNAETTTLRALPVIVNNLRSKGYSLVPLSRLPR